MDTEIGTHNKGHRVTDMGFLKGGAGLLRLRKHNIGHKDILDPWGVGQKAMGIVKRRATGIDMNQLDIYCCQLILAN